MTNSSLTPDNEIITIPEFAKRLRISKEDAYNMAETPGFPLYNLGGPRKNRTIWGEALEWVKKNFKASSASA